MRGLRLKVSLELMEGEDGFLAGKGNCLSEIRGSRDYYPK